MSLWTPVQRDCLEAMGFDVLHLRDLKTAAPSVAPDAVISAPSRASAASDGLRRAARGVGLDTLLLETGRPVDVASRRAFWRILRPLRKATRDT